MSKSLASDLDAAACGRESGHNTALPLEDVMLTVARALAKLPVALVPAGFRVQPIEADEVAARLVELTSGEPARQVPDMGGPRVYGAADLLGGYLRATTPRFMVVEP